MTKKAKYKNVSIPDKLADAIDKFIKDNKNLDFRSRAEVINYSVRQILIKDKNKHDDKKL